MTALLRSIFLDRSILLQLGIALVICQLLAHGLTFTAIIWRYDRPDLLTATSVNTTQAIGFYEILAKANSSESATLSAVMHRAHPWTEVIEAVPLESQIDNPERHNAMYEGLLRARPDLAGRMILLAGQTSSVNEHRIALRLDDTRYFTFLPQLDGQRITFPRILASLFIAVLMLPLAVLAVWALAMLTAPLRRLAGSAERFAIDLDPTPLPEVGAKEIRTLAKALNSMRGRIRQLVDSRSRMLAAVSHDLRTPLTRLRLKTEALAEGDDKEKMLRDISSMNKMIGQALSYLRDQTTGAAREPVDLTTLVESICSDFTDMGNKVSFKGQRGVVLDCEPDLLTRAVTNLLDNAIKFSGHASVQLEIRSASEAVIYVEDDGPGIPDAEKFYAFEPFSRGDPSRSGPAAESFGLGLAIAKQIVERHGGQITLHDREPHGLRVQIVLPFKGDSPLLVFDPIQLRSRSLVSSSFG